jgi:hypothetical protein
MYFVPTQTSATVVFVDVQRLNGSVRPALYVVEAFNESVWI